MKNLGDMMRQVQEMQSRLQDVQQKMEELTVTGEAGGGMVRVSVNGKGILKELTIDESLFKPDEKDIVEDLIIAAVNDARTKAEGMIAKEMQSVTGGLPLPPGFKLPL